MEDARHFGSVRTRGVPPPLSPPREGDARAAKALIYFSRLRCVNPVAARGRGTCFEPSEVEFALVEELFAERCGVGAVVGADRAQGGGDVQFDGAFRNVEPLGDVLVGQALDQ